MAPEGDTSFATANEALRWIVRAQSSKRPNLSAHDPAADTTRSLGPIPTAPGSDGSPMGGNANRTRDLLPVLQNDVRRRGDLQDLQVVSPTVVHKLVGGQQFAYVRQFVVIDCR